MKNILILLVAVVAISCDRGAKETYYGEHITSDDSITASALAQALESTDSLYAKVKGEILQTCSMKGCWMTMDMGEGNSMRVTFKDYGFFVPKEGVSGKETIIEGVATKTVTDVETLRHFARDEGKSEAEIAAITSPQEEITFVATGVIILDAEGA